MKKTLLLTIALLLCFALFGCNKTGNSNKTVTTSKSTTTTMSHGGDCSHEYEGLLCKKCGESIFNKEDFISNNVNSLLDAEFKIGAKDITINIDPSFSIKLNEASLEVGKSTEGNNIINLNAEVELLAGKTNTVNKKGNLALTINDGRIYGKVDSAIIDLVKSTILASDSSDVLFTSDDTTIYFDGSLDKLSNNVEEFEMINTLVEVGEIVEDKSINLVSTLVNSLIDTTELPMVHQMFELLINKISTIASNFINVEEKDLNGKKVLALSIDFAKIEEFVKANKDKTLLQILDLSLIDKEVIKAAVTSVIELNVVLCKNILGLEQINATIESLLEDVEDKELPVDFEDVLETANTYIEDFLDYAKENPLKTVKDYFNQAELGIDEINTKDVLDEMEEFFKSKPFEDINVTGEIFPRELKNSSNYLYLNKDGSFVGIDVSLSFEGVNISAFIAKSSSVVPNEALLAEVEANAPSVDVQNKFYNFIIELADFDLKNVEYEYDDNGLIKSAKFIDEHYEVCEYNTNIPTLSRKYEIEAEKTIHFQYSPVIVYSNICDATLELIPLIVCETNFVIPETVSYKYYVYDVEVPAGEINFDPNAFEESKLDDSFELEEFISPLLYSDEEVDLFESFDFLDLHNLEYVSAESEKGETCGDLNKEVYECTKCHKKYTTYSLIPHDYHAVLVSQDASKCEDKIEYKYVCSICHDETEVEEAYDHECIFSEPIELNGKCCDCHHFSISKCACGEDFYIDCDYSNFDYSSYYTNGKDIISYECLECGLKYEIIYIYADGCQSGCIIEYRVSIDDEVLFERSKGEFEENHYYYDSYGYVLENGKTSCTEGVSKYPRCEFCGEIDYDSKDVTTVYAHEDAVGSVYLETIYDYVVISYYGCPCGEIFENFNVNLSNDFNGYGEVGQVKCDTIENKTTEIYMFVVYDLDTEQETTKYFSIEYPTNNPTNYHITFDVNYTE